jgi:hypothetical protein
MLEKGQNLPQASLISCYRALLISSLVAANFDFETTRKSPKGTSYIVINIVFSDNLLQDLTRGFPILDLVYDTTIFFCESLLHIESSTILLTSLGVLLNATPSFFIRTSTLKIIKSVFDGQKNHHHLEILNLFTEYLEKHTRADENAEIQELSDKPIDMSVLVGNAESFSEDGIPTSLVQSFLDSVILDVQRADPLVSIAAFRVVTIAVENGLVHPIKCIPAICAIESSADDGISQQAFQLHQKLNEKHSSFIHSKNMEAIKSVFEYQRNSASRLQQPLRGFHRDSSCINPLFNLVRTQKLRRNAFLKSLIGLFDSPTKKDDVTYLQFVAENLAYLEYKTVEEIYHVIFHINLLLSVSGEELRTVFDGFGEGEIPPVELQFKALSFGTLIQLRNFLQKRFGFSLAQGLSCGAASNSANSTEKSAAIHNSLSLQWNKSPADMEIVEWYLNLSEDCLGEGEDLDYVEKILMDSKITPRKDNITTPKSGAAGKKRKKLKDQTPSKPRGKRANGYLVDPSIG